MSTSQSLFEASPKLPEDVHTLSPKRLLMILAGIIFSAEIVTMTILYYLRIPDYFVDTLLDGMLMLVMILPGLYFLQWKPLLHQIEERDRVERALRTNEELLRKVLELLPVGVFIVGESGKILLDNPRSRQIWGDFRQAGVERYDQFVGRASNSDAFLAPGEWAVSKAILHGEAYINEEVEIETFTGDRKIILNSAIPILDEHESIQGAVVVNQDITSRRLAEKERTRLNEILERFFSSISTLIAYMDKDFNFIRVNDTYARAGGHPPEFYIGRRHFELYPHSENEAIFKRVVETGEAFSVLEREFEYHDHPERGKSYWDWSLQPVKGTEGKVDGVVLSLVDVTERKQAELKLARQNEELRALYLSESVARQFAETLSAASLEFTETLELEYVLEALLNHTKKMIPVDVAVINLLEDETNLAVHAVQGDQEWWQQEINTSNPRDTITDSVFQRLKKTHRSLVIPKRVSPAMLEQQVSIRQQYLWLIVPIVASHKIIGLVELGKGGDEQFSPEQIRWAEAIVAQAAVAIQNAWLFEQARLSNERLQSLTHKMVKIQESEREHIARELHDEAGQALSSLKLSLGRVEQDPDCSEGMKTQLRKMKSVADGILEELHRLALDLRPVALDRLGLVPALQQYIHHLESEPLSVQFKAVGFDNCRLPRDVETSIYRIVQEATTNAIRHSQATHVGILIELADKIKLFVEDNGTGFIPNQVDLTKHMGLSGMRERTEMLGGSLSIESTPGMGTSIIVEVPYGYADSDC